MKIVICWSHISGYMAACWRALAAREGVELFILAFAAEGNAAFERDILAGLRCELLDATQRNDSAAIRDRVLRERPDVIVIGGWMHPPYRDLAGAAELKSAKFVMAMDTPLKLDWRQRLARLKIGRYLDRMDCVAVAGERSFQLARYLKVPESKILRGAYGYDDAPLANLLSQRASGPWPRSFLYTGRYVEEKGIDILLDSYTRYRSLAPDPWPLSCCGAGPLKAMLAGIPGVTDLGFVQPRDLPGVFQRHGVFVLLSRYEPWGVALAEAMAAGLPAIASEAVGASVELLRHLHNGFLAPTNDPAKASAAMYWMHTRADQIPKMGGNARSFAVAYTAEHWADRWHEKLLSL